MTVVNWKKKKSHSSLWLLYPDAVTFSSPWVWAGLVSCCDQHKAAEVTLWVQGLKALDTSTYTPDTPAAATISWTSLGQPAGRWGTWSLDKAITAKVSQLTTEARPSPDRITWTWARSTEPSSLARPKLLTN